MVLERSPGLDRTFHALAHPARRAILRQLARGEHNLSQLAAPLRMSFPAASKHVRVLEKARLVHREIRGRTHVCRLDVKPLSQIEQWTEQCRELWEANFTRLDAVLEELKAAEGIAPSGAAAPSNARSHAPGSRARARGRRS